MQGTSVGIAGHSREPPIEIKAGACLARMVPPLAFDTPGAILRLVRDEETRVRRGAQPPGRAIGRRSLRSCGVSVLRTTGRWFRPCSLCALAKHEIGDRRGLTEAEPFLIHTAGRVHVVMCRKDTA